MANEKSRPMTKTTLHCHSRSWDPMRLPRSFTACNADPIIAIRRSRAEGSFEDMRRSKTTLDLEERSSRELVTSRKE